MKKFKMILIPESSNFKPIRAMLLLFIFSACAYAYSYNFQNKIDHYNSVFIDDKYKKLSKSEISKLNDIRLSFKTQIGIGLDILVEDDKADALQVPSLKADEIFIGVNVARNEAVIIVPMLVKKAIGAGARLLIEEELSSCLQKNTAFQCISDASLSIFEVIANN